jgi:hypothetical protein
MDTLTSLRAKRSNPALENTTGLPRRCAPRNDVILRAFAASREPNFFLSSREAAKPRRRSGIIFGILLALALSSPAIACEPTPKEFLLHVSVLVVEGRGDFSLSGSILGGKIFVSKPVKGRSANSISVTFEMKDQGSNCPNSWVPKKSGKYAGTFYLRKLPMGRFGVIKFFSK